jgi:hypothetical protein
LTVPATCNRANPTKKQVENNGQTVLKVKFMTFDPLLARVAPGMSAAERDRELAGSAD